MPSPPDNRRSLVGPTCSAFPGRQGKPIRSTVMRPAPKLGRDRVWGEDSLVRRTIWLAAAAACLGAAPAQVAPAQAAECGSLANLRIDAVNLFSAAEVPAAGDLPAYCRVLGEVRPAI